MITSHFIVGDHNVDEAINIFVPVVGDDVGVVGVGVGDVPVVGVVHGDGDVPVVGVVHGDGVVPVVGVGGVMFSSTWQSVALRAADSVGTLSPAGPVRRPDWTWLELELEINKNLDPNSSSS